MAEWHGKMLVDRNGEKIGKLQDVYVDVETDAPQFAHRKKVYQPPSDLRPSRRDSSQSRWASGGGDEGAGGSVGAGHRDHGE